MIKLSKRCDKLEKETEAWTKERNGFIAKFKTDLEFEKAKYTNELELADATLNN